MMFKIIYEQSQIRLKLPQNILILILVFILHILLIVYVWYLLPPYLSPESPNIRALRVHFISTPALNHQVAQTTTTQHVMEQGAVSPKQSVEAITSAKELSRLKQNNKIIATTQSHQLFFKDEQNNQRSSMSQDPEQQDRTHNLPAYEQSHLTPVKAALEAKSPNVVLEAHVRQPYTVQSKDTIEQIKQGGEEITAQSQQSVTLPSLAHSSPVMPLSRIDVISFGKLKYYDRELQGQQRLVILRLQIDQKGQPVEVTLQQSSGIDTLDRRAIRAAKIARFEPYRENGHATDVVVDYPIEFSFGHSLSN